MSDEVKVSEQRDAEAPAINDRNLSAANIAAGTVYQRVARGMTRQQLANLAGLKLPRIVGMENGGRNLRFSEIEAVANVFGLVVTVRSLPAQADETQDRP